MAVGKREESGLWRLNIRLEPFCLPFNVPETSGNLVLKLSLSFSIKYNGKVRRDSWNGPEDWMRTRYLKHSESTLAQSWQSRMLFIISVLLLETQYHIRESNWKVKGAQGTSFIHIHQFVRAPFRESCSRRKGSIWKDFRLEEEIYNHACPPHVISRLS